MWMDVYVVGCVVFLRWEGLIIGRMDEVVVLLKELFVVGLVECDLLDFGSYSVKWRVVKRGDG